MIEIVVTLLILCVVSLFALQVYFNALSAEKQRVEESRLALLNACIKIQSLRRSVIARRVFIDRLLEKRRLEFVARRKLAICKMAFAGLNQERLVGAERKVDEALLQKSQEVSILRATMVFLRKFAKRAVNRRIIRKCLLDAEAEEPKFAVVDFKPPVSSVILHYLAIFMWWCRIVAEVIYVCLEYAISVSFIFALHLCNLLLCVFIRGIVCLSVACVFLLRRAFKFALDLASHLLTVNSDKVTVETGPRRVRRNGRAETNKFVSKCMEKVRKIRAGNQE